MKTNLLLLGCILFLMACRKSEETPTSALNEMVPEEAEQLATGVFQNGNHPTSGRARMILSEGKWSLVLEDFSTDPGPDLRVYLASNLQAQKFINLGKLKSTSGTQVYGVDGMPELASYPYVLIWCQQFSVLFGQAKMMQ